MPTNPITTRLIQAILTRAREVDGHVTKTKLLKYLYLFDLEWYRRKRALLTGLPWMFHLYGPWAREFEALYSELAKDGVIRVRPFSSGDLEGERVDTPEQSL